MSYSNETRMLEQIFPSYERIKKMYSIICQNI